MGSGAGFFSLIASTLIAIVELLKARFAFGLSGYPLQVKIITLLIILAIPLEILLDPAESSHQMFFCPKGKAKSRIGISHN